MIGDETKYFEPLTGKKEHLRHLTNAGMDFQDEMFDYMVEFIFIEMLPDTCDYTKLFGLWKGKGANET